MQGNKRIFVISLTSFSLPQFPFHLWSGRGHFSPPSFHPRMSVKSFWLVSASFVARSFLCRFSRSSSPSSSFRFFLGSLFIRLILRLPLFFFFSTSVFIFFLLRCLLLSAFLLLYFLPFLPCFLFPLFCFLSFLPSFFFLFLFFFYSSFFPFPLFYFSSFLPSFLSHFPVFFRFSFSFPTFLYFPRSVSLRCAHL